jgi:hypothetical protein
VDIASSLTIAQGPADHERDAVRRWRDTATELTELEKPLPDVHRDTLFEAQRRLHHVFIELWALREATISHGVDKAVVDAAIDADRDGLALAHDVGNLAKHGSLSRPARSGHKPTFGRVFGVQPGAGGEISFSLGVNWDGIEVDGLRLARRAVNAWEQSLTRWGVV